MIHVHVLAQIMKTDYTILGQSSELRAMREECMQYAPTMPTDILHTLSP